MPAAAPIPRGPSVTTLYSAADLLTGPGCPVCRYAGEASDRHLAWFAVEAHAQTATITRLRASLGMCSRHTRALMSQPGAAARLTAVYRYIIEAARDYLNGRATRLGACPACEHDDGAVGRALDTLLEGLTDDSIRERYRNLGGLCIPHLRDAMARGDRRTVGWLSGTLQATLSAQLDSPGWLTGTDHDADVRAVLRQAIPADVHRDSGVCLACLAAGRSESGQLARILRAGEIGWPDRRLLLCATHLNDLAILVGPRGLLPLLAWQADCLAAHLTRLTASPPRWKPGNPASWLRPLRRAAGLASCAVCHGKEAAAAQALDDIRALLRASQPASDPRVPLCARHLLTLRAVDPWAGQVTARSGVERAEMLITELNEAFRKGTWAHRSEIRGTEMTAWRRAAAFLDGGVFCGRPPPET
jgi:hypothetical protein